MGGEFVLPEVVTDGLGRVCKSGTMHMLEGAVAGAVGVLIIAVIVFVIYFIKFPPVR